MRLLSYCVRNLTTQACNISWKIVREDDYGCFELCAQLRHEIMISLAPLLVNRAERCKVADGKKAWVVVHRGSPSTYASSIRECRKAPGRDAAAQGLGSCEEQAFHVGDAARPVMRAHDTNATFGADSA
jgi:hypothetical protein